MIWLLLAVCAWLFFSAAVAWLLDWRSRKVAKPRKPEFGFIFGLMGMGMLRR
jgi:hypothetical protein